MFFFRTHTPPEPKMLVFPLRLNRSSGSIRIVLVEVHIIVRAVEPGDVIELANVRELRIDGA